MTGKPSTLRQAAMRLAKTFASAFMLVLAVEMVVHVLNPFGIDEHIEKLAAASIEKVTASLESSKAPSDQTSKSSSENPNVTVVLIDEPFARTAGAGAANTDPVWPLPIDTLMTKVLLPVLKHKPAAVFLDLSFPNAPREITPGGKADLVEAQAKLAKYFRMIDANPTMPPVIIADVLEPSAVEHRSNTDCPGNFISTTALPSSGIMATQLRNDIFANKSVVFGASAKIIRTDTAVSSPDGAYKLASVLTGASGSCQKSYREGKAYILSPALLLAKIFCAEPGHEPYCALKKLDSLLTHEVKALPGAVAVTAPGGAALMYRDQSGFSLFELDDELRTSNAMDLRWRTTLSSGEQKLVKDKEDSDRCAHQITNSLWEPVRVYFALAHGGQVQFDRPCPFIDTLTPEALAAEDGVEQPGDSLGKKFIEDRIVLIGASLRQTNDWTTSPISGRIPGVYLHAVAVENLLTRGAGFAHADTDMFHWLILIVFDAFLVALLMLAWRKAMRKVELVAPPFGTLIIMPALFLVVTFGVSFGLVLIIERCFPVLPMVEVALPVATVYLWFIGEWETTVHKWTGKAFTGLYGKLGSSYSRKFHSKQGTTIDDGVADSIESAETPESTPILPAVNVETHSHSAPVSAPD